MALFGIDITKWNGDLNFTAVRAAGVRFAMVKATQGHALASPLYLYADTRFEKNIKGLAAAGIPAGAYHYFTASTKSEALKEADYFIKTAAQYRDCLPLYLACHVEANGNRYLEGLDHGTLSELAALFCDRVTEAGFKACLYASTEGVQECIDLDAIPYPLWQAHYGSGGSVKRPTEAGERLAIHQYTNDGQIIGIPGGFGLNFGYAPLARIIIKHFTPIDDVVIEHIHRSPTGDEILMRLADKIIARSLKPIKDTTTEKLASLIRYHCALTFSETEHLLAYHGAKALMSILYASMLRR